MIIWSSSITKSHKSSLPLSNESKNQKSILKKRDLLSFALLQDPALSVVCVCVWLRHCALKTTCAKWFFRQSNGCKYHLENTRQKSSSLAKRKECSVQKISKSARMHARARTHGTQETLHFQRTKNWVPSKNHDYNIIISSQWQWIKTMLLLNNYSHQIVAD